MEKKFSGVLLFCHSNNYEKDIITRSMIKHVSNYITIDKYDESADHVMDIKSNSLVKSLSEDYDVRNKTKAIIELYCPIDQITNQKISPNITKDYLNFAETQDVNQIKTRFKRQFVLNLERLLKKNGKYYSCHFDLYKIYSPYNMKRTKSNKVFYTKYKRFMNNKPLIRKFFNHALNSKKLEVVKLKNKKFINDNLFESDEFDHTCIQAK